jgi:hypothetical protein
LAFIFHILTTMRGQTHIKNSRSSNLARVVQNSYHQPTQCVVVKQITQITIISHTNLFQEIFYVETDTVN